MTQEHPARPQVIEGHVTIRTGLARWTCPKCGQEHAVDVRPLVAENAAAEWYECPSGAGGYYVTYRPTVKGHLRRAHGIPEPDYAALRRKYGIPEPDEE